MSGGSKQFKRSMMMTATLRRWSSGAHARRFPNYYQQGRTGTSRGAATTARQLLILVAVVVVR